MTGVLVKERKRREKEISIEGYRKEEEVRQRQRHIGSERATRESKAEQVRRGLERIRQGRYRAARREELRAREEARRQKAIERAKAEKKKSVLRRALEADRRVKRRKVRKATKRDRRLWVTLGKRRLKKRTELRGRCVETSKGRSVESRYKISRNLLRKELRREIWSGTRTHRR